MRSSVNVQDPRAGLFSRAGQPTRAGPGQGITQGQGNTQGQDQTQGQGNTQGQGKTQEQGKDLELLSACLDLFSNVLLHVTDCIILHLLSLALQPQTKVVVAIYLFKHPFW